MTFKQNNDGARFDEIMFYDGFFDFCSKNPSVASGIVATLFPVNGGNDIKIDKNAILPNDDFSVVFNAELSFDSDISGPYLVTHIHIQPETKNEKSTTIIMVFKSKIVRENLDYSFYDFVIVELTDTIRKVYSGKFNASGVAQKIVRHLFERENTQ